MTLQRNEEKKKEGKEKKRKHIYIYIYIYIHIYKPFYTSYMTKDHFLSRVEQV